MNFKLLTALILFSITAKPMDTIIDPIMQSVCNNDAMELKMLIKSGNSIDQTTYIDDICYTPLLRAIDTLNIGIMEILLQHNPMLSYQEKRITSRGRQVIRKIDTLKFVEKLKRKIEEELDDLYIELIEEDDYTEKRKSVAELREAQLKLLNTIHTKLINHCAVK